MNRSCNRILVGLLGMLVVAAACADEPQERREVRVMSFNIRYGTADDGANHWTRRKDFVVETIRAFSPDLLGTQETLGFQRDYLSQELKDYEVLGAGRDDGAERGEMSALYFRRDRFQKLDGGHFWLSEAPEKPGSKSWDSSLPRMVTWVKLAEKPDNQRPPVYFFNTHFDHRGVKAREESAKLIAGKITELAKDGPVILTGDFNCGEGSAPYRPFFAKRADGSCLLIDTLRAKHPAAGKEDGTFHAFDGGKNGERIDWIGVSPHFEVLDAAIDHSARAGKYPSDHFPITATLKRK